MDEATGRKRGVRCIDDKLHPPDAGWGERVYLVVVPTSGVCVCVLGGEGVRGLGEEGV